MLRPAREPGRHVGNLAVACAECNMVKRARLGEREVAKHRELLALYPDGYCTILRARSGIAEGSSTVVFDLYWESCWSCNRPQPNPARCEDCRDLGRWYGSSTGSTTRCASRCRRRGARVHRPPLA